MELTKLDVMILSALIDHGPFEEDSDKTKGSEEWQDALGHLNNSTDRLKRVPGAVLEARVKSLLCSGHLEGSFRLFIRERLAITDTGRLAEASSVIDDLVEAVRHQIAWYDRHLSRNPRCTGCRQKRDVAKSLLTRLEELDPEQRSAADAIDGIRAGLAATRQDYAPRARREELDYWLQWIDSRSQPASS